MLIKNENVLEIFKNGNKEMEKAILDAGISEASIRKAKAWMPPQKLPKDYIAIGKVLQSFITKG